MKLKLSYDNFKYEKKEIQFYLLEDYKTQPNEFYTEDFRDIEKISNWHRDAFTRMYEIASSRRNIIKKIENLQKNKNNMPITEYIDELLELFYFDYSDWNSKTNSPTSFLKDIDNNDILKKEVLKKIEDKTLKKLKTNIVKSATYGMFDDEPKPNENLTFFVLSKENLDLNKTYSQEEILELYHSKKILVVKIQEKPTTEKGNSSGFKRKIYARKDGRWFTHFPEWYRQPIVAEIIRDNLEVDKQIEDILTSFKEESKELAHLMVKSMYSIYERQKAYVDENYQKEKEANKKRYLYDLEEAKRNFDYKEEKTEKEKKDFDDSKQEMEETIEELLM